MKLTKKQFSALIKELKSYKPARLTVKGSNFSYNVYPDTSYWFTACDPNANGEYDYIVFEASDFETSCTLLKYLTGSCFDIDSLAPWKTAKAEFREYKDRINSDLNAFASKLRKKYKGAVDFVLSIGYCPRYQDYERLLKKQELFRVLARES